MVLRVAGLRLRVREVRRAEMPSALRRSKRAGAYIYVTVVATYTHHCPGRALAFLYLEESVPERGERELGRQVDDINEWST